MLRHGIILVLFALILNSCTRGEKPVSNETLRIGLASPIASFDPIHATDDSNTLILQLFYQPLFTLKQEGNSWPKTEANILKELPTVSENGLEMRLQLKPGVRFASREANARDLAITILRNSDRRLNAKYADVVENIEGVKEWWKGAKDPEKLPSGLSVQDGGTLLIRFITPSPNWWYNLSVINFSLVPAESFGKNLDLPDGTGSYQVRESTADRLVLTKKNGPGPQQIEYRIFQNRSEEAQSLMIKNELDILPLSPDQATTWFAGSVLKKDFQDKNQKVFFGTTGQYVAFLLNPKLKEDLKKQIHIRLNQHLDRSMAALSLGPFLHPCASLYRCDAELPLAKKYEGKDILKVKILLNAKHGDAATKEALGILLKNAGIEAIFADGSISNKGTWTADLALIDLNMATYDPTDLLSLGNSPKNISEKIFPETAKTQPSAASLESLSLWARDESDLIAIARRRSAAIANPQVNEISFTVLGWLDPRSVKIKK